MTVLVYVLWYVFAGFPLWEILEMELLLDDVLLCESTALLVMQTFLPSYCLKTVLLRVFLILKHSLQGHQAPPLCQIYWLILSLHLDLVTAFDTNTPFTRTLADSFAYLLN